MGYLWRAGEQYERHDGPSSLVDDGASPQQTELGPFSLARLHADARASVSQLVRADFFPLVAQPHDGVGGRGNLWEARARESPAKIVSTFWRSSIAVPPTACRIV